VRRAGTDPRLPAPDRVLRLRGTLRATLAVAGTGAH